MLNFFLSFKVTQSGLVTNFCGDWPFSGDYKLRPSFGSSTAYCKKSFEFVLLKFNYNVVVVFLFNQNKKGIAF